MKHETAYLGAGCFWGVEEAYRTLPGVVSTSVGFMGGSVANPTYAQVCEGNTGHAEVTEVVFDPEKISYERILDMFWKLHDPTQVNRQGPDVGYQYRSAIFFTTPEQERVALESKEHEAQNGGHVAPIATAIEPAGDYWKAEDYHQQYFLKNGGGTCHV